MDVLQNISLRQHQFSDLHLELLSAYSVLETQYQQQKIELIEYKCQANYWQAQFKQIKSKESEWLEKISALEALLRKREQQLFGRSSERSTPQSEKQKSVLAVSRPRGHQPGARGHAKRSYDQLPSVEEIIPLPLEKRVCGCCGCPLKVLTRTEDSQIIEVIHVSAYQRVIRRHRYERCCACSPEEAGKRLITAPVAARLLPKSKLGASVWALLLIKKYAYQQPLNRVLNELSANGLSLAMGTVVDGWKRLLPLLMPIYDAISQRNLEADHWHADETRWRVFEAIEGKANSRWYLWIFSSKETVVYKLDPTRSSAVPKAHFGEEAKGIVSVDRYVAYKVVAKAGLLVLAFCWAHVRRDFLSHAKSYPKEEAWALGWVKRIGKLYQLNHERLVFSVGSAEFKKADCLLSEEVKDFRRQMDEEVKEGERITAAKSVLISLSNHWEGLTVFVTHPHIPMDNNTAERGLRDAVVGRKVYYGSGSQWAGELAVVMLTMVATLKLWGLNAHTWLLAYFQECSVSGEVPKSIESFLPWQMTDKQKILFSQPPIGEESG